jgi:hypothetical protein
LYKKGTFHHKKGHFSSFEPPVPTPLLAAVNNIVNIENDSQGGQE